MTSATFSDFLTPSPHVSVTLTQLISTLVCFWGTPPLPLPVWIPCVHAPLAHLWMSDLKLCLISFTRFILGDTRDISHRKFIVRVTGKMSCCPRIYLYHFFHQYSSNFLDFKSTIQKDFFMRFHDVIRDFILKVQRNKK